MFHLESSIVNWRNQMLAAGIQTPVPLEELESHLREEFQELIASGMAPSAAFAAAIEKIGPPAPLRTEFKKVEKPDDRQARFIVTLAVMCLIIPLYLYSLHKYQDELDLAWRVAAITNILLLCASIIGRRFIDQLFPVISDKRHRLAIGISVAACSMAGMIAFMNFILPGISLNLGQLFVVVLWGVTLMAAGGAVLSGLDEAARKATTPK